jgi:hypothetical protein
VVIECSKGCGRTARKVGLCGSHYAAMRQRQMILGRWVSRSDPTGTTRRLQALMAIGYTQAALCRAMQLNASHLNRLINGHLGYKVNAGTAAKVKDVYRQLSMTPGPHDRARRFAKARGWAPPLAWDEDTIDDPAAKPDLGEKVVVGFVERYEEMRDLGYNDLQIVSKWSMKPESLNRQLDRYGIKPSPELVNLVTAAKHRKRVAS